MMSRSLVIASLAAVLAGPACSKSSSPTPAGETAASGSSSPTPVNPVPPRRMKPPLAPRLDSGGDQVSDGDDAGSGSDGDRRQRFRDRVAKFDTDADGVLSLSERMKMGEERTARMLERFDTDTDGRLSKVEVDASPLGRRLGGFEVADSDRDGFLNDAEINSALAAATLDRSGFRRRRGDGNDGMRVPDDDGRE